MVLVTLNIKAGDRVPEIKRLAEGRGVDVAIEALGRQETFESGLKAALHASSIPVHACSRACK